MSGGVRDWSVKKQRQERTEMTLIFLTQHERSALTFFQTDDSDSDLESERLSLLEPVPGRPR